MKTTKISAGQGNSGFSFYGKVLSIEKYDNRDALIVEKISGEDPGKKFIVVQREDADYTGNKFDADGLTSLKIKKGTTIGLSETHYLSKGSEDGSTMPVVEVRRASKVGRDFRQEQALAIASYGASMGRLYGYIMNPRNGIHGADDQDKEGVLVDLIEKTLPKLSDTQGLMIVINGKNEDGSGITVHRAISRFTRKNSDAPAVLASLKDFRAKVFELLKDCSLNNFIGNQQVDIAGVYGSSNPIKIAVVPSESILLTGTKYLDNDRRAVNTGIGSVGLAIDPANDERNYPIIQVSAMEMAGLLGFRRKEGKNYVGDKVIQQKDDFIFTRLTRQIDLLNGINPDADLTVGGGAQGRSDKPSSNAPEKPAQTNTLDSKQEEMPPANDIFDFDDNDPFNFENDDDVAGLGY